MGGGVDMNIHLGSAREGYPFVGRPQGCYTPGGTPSPCYGIGDLTIDQLPVGGSQPVVDPTYTAPCMPTGNQGPLQAGQVWCATGSVVPPGAVQSSCPVGSTCSIIASVPDSWLLGLAGAVGLLLFVGMSGGKR